MKVNPAALAVAAGPLVVMVGAAAILLGAAAGYHPPWPADEQTIAEAIMLRDPGALLRLLETTPDLTRK